MSRCAAEPNHGYRAAVTIPEDKPITAAALLELWREAERATTVATRMVEAAERAAAAGERAAEAAERTAAAALQVADLAKTSADTAEESAMDARVAAGDATRSVRERTDQQARSGEAETAARETYQRRVAEITAEGDGGS